MNGEEKVALIYKRLLHGGWIQVKNKLGQYDDYLIEGRRLKLVLNSENEFAWEITLDYRKLRVGFEDIKDTPYPNKGGIL